MLQSEFPKRSTPGVNDLSLTHQTVGEKHAAWIGADIRSAYGAKRLLVCSRRSSSSHRSRVAQMSVASPTKLHGRSYHLYNRTQDTATEAAASELERRLYAEALP